MPLKKEEKMRKEKHKYKVSLLLQNNNIAKSANYGNFSIDTVIKITPYQHHLMHSILRLVCYQSVLLNQSQHRIVLKQLSV